MSDNLADITGRSWRDRMRACERDIERRFESAQQETALVLKPGDIIVLRFNGPLITRDEVEMAREAIERQGVKAIILTREWEVVGRRRCCDE